MSKQRRIVVTGYGILCGLGSNSREVWERMKRNETGISRIRRFSNVKFMSDMAAELKDYRPEDHFSDRERVLYDYCSQYAILAAKEALEHSGFEWRKRKDRVGVVLGTCNGGTHSLEEQGDLDNLDKERTRRFPFHQHGDSVAKYFGLEGPVCTINTACTASGNAIGFAYDLIKQGYADFMLAGGSDFMCLSVYAGFNVLQALNPEPCSPYSRKFGLSLGEGAAFVCLETLDSALERNATVYAEVCGYGLGSDAYHETAPEPNGLGVAHAVEQALKDSGVSKGQIEYINTHGTGTEANDAAELNGLRLVFGERLSEIPLSSSKAYFGHNLGAAGVIEYVTTLMAVNEGFLPATLHFEAFRKGCENVRLVANRMEKGNPEYFLCTNSAFGGHNVAVVSRRWKNDAASAIRPKNDKKRTGRVAIIGMGVVNAFGYAKGSALNMLKLREGLKEFGDGSCEFRLKDYNRDLYERRMNRLSQYSIGAADLALRDAGLNIDEIDNRQIGLIYGTSRGSLESTEKYLSTVFKNPEFSSGVYFPSVVLNSTAGKMEKKLKIKGSGSSLSTGGNDGLMGALYGFEMIRRGVQPYVLVCAGDERSALSSAIDRALGLDEGIFPITEGSCCLVLADLEVARKGAAQVYAEILGFGSTFDGNNHSDGATYRRAVEMALDRSGVSVDDIDFVCFNTNGRPAQLEDEKRTLQQLFANRSLPILCFNDLLGYGESSSSLNHLCIAAEFLYAGQQFPAFSEVAVSGEYLKNGANRGLVIGSTPNGNNIAVVIQRLNQ